MDKFCGDYEGTGARKRHIYRSDTKTTPEFVSAMIYNNSRKLIKFLARKMGVYEFVGVFFYI